MNHTDRTEHPEEPALTPEVPAGNNGHGVAATERGEGVPAERVGAAGAPGSSEDDYSADKIKVLEGLVVVQ